MCLYDYRLFASAREEIMSMSMAFRFGYYAGRNMDQRGGVWKTMHGTFVKTNGIARRCSQKLAAKSCKQYNNRVHGVA